MFPSIEPEFEKLHKDKKHTRTVSYFPKEDEIIPDKKESPATELKKKMDHRRAFSFDIEYI